MTECERLAFNREFESGRHILDADSPGARRETFMRAICVTGCGALRGHDWRPVGDVAVSTRGDNLSALRRLQ